MLGWAVDDVDPTVDDLVDITPVGIRVAWFQDPDGHTLSVHSRS